MSRKLVSVAWILRVVGLLSMLAILAVFMPLSMMKCNHVLARWKTLNVRIWTVLWQTH